MKVLFDTNVILDALLEREPHAKPAIFLLSQVEKNIITGYLGATTLTTIDYLLKKALGRKQAKATVTELLNLFDIAAVNRTTLSTALESKIADYEDAVLNEAALHQNITAIVTRNIKDFKNSILAIYSPSQLCKIITDELH